MMKQSARLLCLLPLLAMTGLEGCSVKEDRSLCPCYVNLDFSPVGSGDDFLRSELVSEAAAGSYSAEIFTTEWRDRTYEFTVPRGEVEMAVIFGGESYSRSGDTLRLKDGIDNAGRLFVWSERAECRDDFYYTAVSPCKQFCELSVLLSYMDKDKHDNYSLVLHGSSDALRLVSLTPIEGEAALRAVWDDEDGIFKILVPRQWPQDPLLLEVWESGGTRPSFTIDIAPMMSAAGYDWSKADLDDASVTLDYANTLVNIEVNEWQADNLINVEI